MKIECTAIEKFKLMKTVQYSGWCPFGDDTCQKSECYNCLNENIIWKIVDEEQSEWCHDCKEYDKENYCCHRWTNQIRKTVKELEDYYHNNKNEKGNG